MARQSRSDRLSTELERERARDKGYESNEEVLVVWFPSPQEEEEEKWGRWMDDSEETVRECGAAVFSLKTTSGV